MLISSYPKQTFWYILKSKGERHNTRKMKTSFTFLLFLLIIRPGYDEYAMDKILLHPLRNSIASIAVKRTYP